MVAHPGDMEEQPMDHPAAATVLPMHPVNNLSLAKGKRTKRRLRAHSPIPFTTLFASPTMAIDDDGDDLRLSLSPPLDNDNDSTTTEEVETAKCLLLLSRGGFSLKLDDRGSNVRNHHGQSLVLPRKNVATAGGGSTGVYTCKTCNRTFSSFQALGGHRTSHRKMKVEKKSTSATFSDESTPPKFSPNSLSLHLGTAETPPKPSPPPLSHRMHECSYCGAEFTSGQALGGHMRKHRGAPISRSFHTPINTSFEEVEIEEPSKRHKTGLPLDLNLPATDDENHKQFGAGKSPSRKYEVETLTPLLIDKV